MISLREGRLLLFCDRADKTWHCIVVLGPKPEHRIENDTGTIQLQEALIRAQSFYLAATANRPPVGNPPRCWDCTHWELTRKQCGLGFVEGRQTGGRYAARCNVFRPFSGA